MVSLKVLYFLVTVQRGGVEKSEDKILEKTFHACVNQAVNPELNKLRRDGFTDQQLFSQLAQISRQHNMHQWQDNSLSTFSQAIPIIVCSEALV